jgi:hypothetical protein
MSTRPHPPCGRVSGHGHMWLSMQGQSDLVLIEAGRDHRQRAVSSKWLFFGRITNLPQQEVSGSLALIDYEVAADVILFVGLFSMK